MILELGGGTSPAYCKHFGNGINVDILDSPLVDIKHDLRRLPLPIESESYPEVYCRFVLEHISWRILPDFIKELYRIAKPGGKVRAIVPNLREQCMMLIREKEIPLQPGGLQLLFGDQNYEDDKWQWNAHASSASPELYEKLFREAGFRHFISTPLIQWIGDQEIIALK
jgi:predicted SAM-dependent methyltransferase